MKKKTSVILCTILLAVVICLSGCDAEQSLPEPPNLEAPAIFDVIVGTEVPSQDVEDANNIVVPEVHVEPELYIRQDTSRSIENSIDNNGIPFTFYPINMAYCLHPGENIRVKYYDEVFGKDIMFYPEDLRVDLFERTKNISLAVVYPNNREDLSDDTVLRESKEIELTNPAPSEYQYMGGVKNSIWFEVDYDSPIKYTDERGGTIWFWVNWKICVEVDHHVVYMMRVKGTTFLVQAPAGLPDIHRLYVPADPKGQAEMEGRLAIYNFKTKQPVLYGDWVDLPTRDDANN